MEVEMFPVFSAQFLLFAVIIVLGLVFMSGVALAFILNCIFKTPRNHYLASSGMIAAVSYVATAGILLYALPPLDWVNGEPGDLRTVLWDHLITISTLVALICFIGWQIAARKRQLP
jgi:Mg2+/citrate symporter